MRLQTSRGQATTETETETEVFSSSQVFSSEPEGTSSSTSESGSSLKRRKRRKKGQGPGNVPTLVDLLSLSYIGILLLRTPVTVADILKWINSGELLYYRAARQVPLGMRERLSGDYQEFLEPKGLLQPQWLHDSVYETLELLHAKFGMDPPVLNVPLIMYRWMRQLDMPIETFAATQRLAALLKIGFVLNFNNTGRSRSAVNYPEVLLMAVFVTATKLLFPFDDIERYTQHETDLFTVSLNWDRWVENRRPADNGEAESLPLSFEQAFSLRDEDCLQYSNSRLDHYLDWYEDNITSEELREHGRAGRDADFRRAMFKMFPIEKEPTAGQHEVNKSHDSRHIRNGGAQTSISMRPLAAAKYASGEHIKRPGSFHRRFRTVSDVEGVALTFLEQAASLAGVSLATLVKVVAWVENKLVRLEERKRKASRGD